MCKRFIKQENGQALAEFSILLPIIILLLAGILVFSRLGGAFIMVNHGAREGARVAALGADDNTIIQEVKDSIVMLDDSNLVVQIIPTGQRTSGASVTVKVDYPVDIDIPVLGQILGSPKWVHGELTMRVE